MHETEPEISLEAAHTAIRLERWGEAVAILERLRQCGPQTWLLYGEACVAHRRLGQWEQADAVIEEGLSRLGEVPELLIAYGDNAMDTQRWTEAMSRWARLRANHPDEQLGWVRAAEAAANAGRLDEAKHLLAAAWQRPYLDKSRIVLARMRIEDGIQPGEEARFLLPPMNFSIPADAAITQQYEHSQVIQRARSLGLALPSAEQFQAWTWLGHANTHIKDPLLVCADKLARNYHGLTYAVIDGHGWLFDAQSEENSNSSYALTFQHCSNLIVKGFDINTAQTAKTPLIYLADCTNITIQNNSFRNYTNAIIVIDRGCRNIIIEDCYFQKCAGAAIFIGPDTSDVVIRNNHIVLGQGKSNWHAGIVVTDRDAQSLKEGMQGFFGPGGYWARPIPIQLRHAPPRSIICMNNTIVGGLSSGIYFDGAVESLIFGNEIRGHSKEGICLDYGATANVVACNTIAANGKRWGKTNQDLARDFVLRDGRMVDGTARAKVPGISIDNAAYNIIVSNAVRHNYGTGIKSVRSAFANVIVNNDLSMNGLGGNVKHLFFGIEFGGARSDTPEDGEAELDFMASIGNYVSGNRIIGWHTENIHEAGASLGQNWIE